MSIEPVPIKYVVVGIVYALDGTATTATYGSYPAGYYPGASSEFGTRFRSVVSKPDGTKTVAALGPIDTGSGADGFDLTPVTTTSAGLVMGAFCVLHPSACGIGFGTGGWAWDISSHEHDEIYLWVNPGAAVATDYSGRKTVAWSSHSGWSAEPFMNVLSVSAGELDGSIPDSREVAMLKALYMPWLEPEDVASILSHDPFFASSSVDSATLKADPRYQFLGSAEVGGTSVSTVPTSWACSSPVTDAAFPVLDTAAVGFGNGETLLLQATTVGLDPSCTVQTPGLFLGTSTPGCSFQADVFVDTAFGTLLTIPTSMDPACLSTGGP